MPPFTDLFSRFSFSLFFFDTAFHDTRCFRRFPLFEMRGIGHVATAFSHTGHAIAATLPRLRAIDIPLEDICLYAYKHAAQA